MNTPILQFGTSRFLQAHALSFFQAGEATGPAPLVTVVQSTDDPARRRRLEALAAEGGWAVRIRGLESGKPVEREERVTLVRRAITADGDADQLRRIFVEEARWIVSNTADRGFEPQPADALSHSAPGQSYPARLFHLLAARHAAGKDPLVLLPTELVPRNGDVLKARVLEIAHANGASDSLLAWLRTQIWVNSLVDRIVSEEIQPAGAVAEPFALWAIEDQPGLVLPVRHPAIQVVADLEAVQRLKLHVLNLGHTALVQLWQQAGGHEVFVREAMAGPLRAPLLRIWEDEVIPGFRARGLEAEARAWVATTIDRFANPFLDHRLSDIAQNHAAKIDHRITAFLAWSGLSPEAAPGLHAISQP